MDINKILRIVDEWAEEYNLIIKDDSGLLHEEESITELKSKIMENKGDRK